MIIGAVCALFEDAPQCKHHTHIYAGDPLHFQPHGQPTPNTYVEAHPGRVAPHKPKVPGSSSPPPPFQLDRYQLQTLGEAVPLGQSVPEISFQ